MKETIFIFGCFVIIGLVIIVASVEKKEAPTQLEVPIRNEIRYDGWQMSCNYTGGSNADWNEEKQEYGDQKYLDCANGLVYEKIGRSKSVTYFKAEDKETNEKYCTDGKVAAFTYENPITGEGGDEFAYCLSW